MTNKLEDSAEQSERAYPSLSLHDFRNLFLFAPAYLAAYYFGSLFGETLASPLWFDDSVLLCALLLTPIRKWWLYLVVALSIRFIPAPHPPVPIWFVFAASANDMLNAMFAAYLLRRIARGSIHLSNLRAFATYLGIAVPDVVPRILELLA